MAGELSPCVHVRLHSSGRLLTCLLDPQRFTPPLAVGESVVVETDGGPSVGTVVRTSSLLAERRLAAAVRPGQALRRASEADATTRLKQKQREQEAYRVALLKIRERGLEMKLTRAEQQPDGSRLVFYFTADGRVDFRELVRELAAEFHTRIEMRHIGTRDEARMLGGYGSCGRPLCCATFLTAFEPVSIKMAKQQDLNLNPSRLSGLCGRLKCCLRYELPVAAGEARAGCGDERSRTGGAGCGTGGCGHGGCGNRGPDQ